MKLPQSISTKSIRKVKGSDLEQRNDLLTVEEPMEIRLIYGANGEILEEAISVTMRTPGQDFELALGFLFTEGIINSFEQVKSIRHCEKVEEENRGNVVKVVLNPDIEVESDRMKRNFFMSSSCGICGKASIEAVSTCIPEFSRRRKKLPFDYLYKVAEEMKREQLIFKYTGSIHSAAIFDLKGDIHVVREDVGRHNAVDKVIGWALMKGMLPLNDYGIMVSGRAGFELVQKALMAGVSGMGAIGAPSSLAVDLARKHAMTLVGFIKEKGCNVYSGFDK